MKMLQKWKDSAQMIGELQDTSTVKIIFSPLKCTFFGLWNMHYDLFLFTYSSFSEGSDTYPKISTIFGLKKASLTFLCFAIVW